jgi:hypothetical protein
MWNVRTLSQGGKLKNLKKEMKNNVGAVLGVSKVWWKGRGEILSDYTKYFIPGMRGLKEVKPLVVHKSIVRNVIKKIVCNNRFIALKMKVEP